MARGAPWRVREGRRDGRADYAPRGAAQGGVQGVRRGAALAAADRGHLIVPGRRGVDSVAFCAGMIRKH